MKCFHLVLGRAVVLAFAVLVTSTHAQSGDYAVTGHGADYNVLQKTTIENGMNHVHQYMELATGMNYTNSQGQLVESKEEIDIQPNGTAAATQGQHKASFPSDIYEGMIQVTTPDGLQLQSRPMGLFYDDGTNTVMIAALTNSIGQLLGTNQVTYTNAFNGFEADLLYTYRKSGFEQDIVLRQQPPPPESFGLASTARLQVLTEFFDGHNPVQQVSPVNQRDGLSDTTLTFGAMKMVRGRAFAIGESSPPDFQNQGTPTYKSWVNLNGRTFLVEAVPYQRLAAQLEQLPAPDGNPGNSENPLLNKISNPRSLPPVRMAQAGTNRVQLAGTDLRRSKGVVLDYEEMDFDTNDFTFYNGTTYFVSDVIGLSGTTTIQGGAVIKFPSGSGQINLDGTSLICPTSPDNPAIFTGQDDDRVGEIISGSTGVLTNYYGSGGGDLSWVGDGSLSNFVFFNQSEAICAGGGSSELFNIQAFNGYVFMSSSEASVDFQNCLFVSNVTVWFGGDTIATAENVTYAGCDWLGYPNDGGGSSLDVENCLVVAVPNYHSDLAYGTNYTVTLDSMTGVFQTAANANYYLATTSPYRDIGTTNINPDLLGELQTMTTYAPQDGGYLDTDLPDLGYHYPPVALLPNQISGLKLWLKADADVTNSSGNISAWGDQSGNGNYAQATTGHQPLLVAGTLNSLPVVRFDGTSSYLNLPNFMNAISATQGEVLAVVKTSGGRGALWQFGSGPSWEAYPDSDGSIGEDFGSNMHYDLGVPAQSLNQYHVYEVSAQATNWGAWINGVLLYQTGNNSVHFWGSPTLGYSDHYLAGDIAEVLLYNRALTVDERKLVNVYLNGKYALVPAAPAAPTNLIARATSQTQIGLTWSESLTNGGVTRISIERKTGGGGTYAAVAQLVNSLSYVDTDLTAGTQYYYRARAVNLITWSGYSNETNATTLSSGSDIPLGNLLLWLKADSGLAQIFTNTPVDLWADQSGHGNDATQPTGTKQPTWVANVLNGLPVVRFNSTNQNYFNLPDLMNANGVTQAEAFVVLKTTTPSSSTGALWELGYGSGWATYPDSSGNIGEHFGSTTHWNLGPPPSNYHAYEVSAQANNWTVWTNGVPMDHKISNTVQWWSHPTLGSNDGGGNYFLGDIAEVLIFNRALTTDERTTVNTYLNNKYGL